MSRQFDNVESMHVYVKTQEVCEDTGGHNRLVKQLGISSRLLRRAGDRTGFLPMGARRS